MLLHLLGLCLLFSLVLSIRRHSILNIVFVVTHHIIIFVQFFPQDDRIVWTVFTMNDIEAEMPLFLFDVCVFFFSFFFIFSMFASIVTMCAYNKEKTLEQILEKLIVMTTNKNDIGALFFVSFFFCFSQLRSNYFILHLILRLTPSDIQNQPQGQHTQKTYTVTNGISITCVSKIT